MRDQFESVWCAELDTPVAVDDLSVVERDIDPLEAACGTAGVANRQHFKTDKSTAIANLQLAMGARGRVA